MHGKRTGVAERLRRWNTTAGELLAASPTAWDGAGPEDDGAQSDRRALDLAKAVLGEEYDDVADGEYARRCHTLYSAPRRDAALAACKRALREEAASLGKTHPDVATAHYLVGLIHAKRGKTKETTAWCDGALHNISKIAYNLKNKYILTSMQLCLTTTLI